MLSIQKTGLLIVALVCAMPVCAQQVYQWKDEQGKTHYSDIPPPNEANEAVRQIQATPPPAPQSSPSQPNWAEKNLQFRERQEKAAEETAQAAQQRQKEEERQRVCAQARNSLEMLTSGIRVARPDATGERVYMDDASRAAAIEQNQRFIKENCQ